MAHVTFIHGIANKPPKERLLQAWLHSLEVEDGLKFGVSGVSSSMVYWADVLYDQALEEAGLESAEAVPEAVQTEPVDLDVEAMGSEEEAWTESLAVKLGLLEGVEDLAAGLAVEEGPVEEGAAGAPGAPGAPGMDKTRFQESLERIPLPWFVKRRLMKLLLRDVHHYLFNAEHSPRAGERFKVQDEIRARALAVLREGAAQEGPHILVCHSMGTVIAYDCLKRVPACPRVDALVTVGSPLGIDEVQDKLRPEWNRKDGFPAEKLAGSWINVYDRLDPVVGFDPVFANDYRRNGEKVVEDVNQQSDGTWRHDIRKYLQGELLRSRLRELLRLD